MAPPSPPRTRNKSLERGLALLGALAERPGGASVPELATATGLPRTTTARLLGTLHDLGAASRHGSRIWSLGPEMTRLGRIADPFASLRERSREILRHVSSELEESTMAVAIYESWEMETILQFDAATRVGAADWRGRRESGFLHAAASGKLALAELPDDEALAAAEPLITMTPQTITSPAALIRELDRVREQGWAVTADELEVGLTAIAVPLDEPATRSAACARGLSISVSGPSARLPESRHASAAATLRRAAECLEPA